MTGDADPFDLARFVAAQDGVYERALDELRRGRKESHWMWFVFPQIAGLGHSAMAQHYAIGSLDEARAYWAHPLLGPRLRACIEALLLHRGKSALEILGSPDDLKLRSSLTLFDLAVPGEPLFPQALAAFHGGRRDDATVALVVRQG